MAEDQDKSQKTEEPSQRRLDEARREGQVASSREVNNALVLASGALFVGALAPGAAARLAETMRPFVERPHAIAIDALEPALQALLAALGWALLPAVLLFVVAALASGLIQHGPLWTAAPLAPKLERISPVAGAKRLFALRSLVEFLKGLVKIVLVGAAATLLLWPTAPRVLSAIEVEAGALLALLHALALRLLLGVAALTALVAILDSLYQRFERHKQLRMSRRDLQDEFKQTEGDPFIKARLKSLRMERARRRMMAEVPNATVVVTNPSHVAIALHHGGAPAGGQRHGHPGRADPRHRPRAWGADRAQPAARARCTAASSWAPRCRRRITARSRR